MYSVFFLWFSGKNWQEADQLAIYKCSQGVELRATKQQLQTVVRGRLKPRTSGFQV